MENSQNNYPATQEGVWAGFHELRQLMKENEQKAETFRILCPDYADFNIYLGFASLSFYKELEQECINQGIAIIKQVGDTVVINDEHLKVY